MGKTGGRAGHRRGPVPRALAWAVLAGGLALAWVGMQRQAPPVAATAEAVAATGALLEAWRAGEAAAAGAWVAPAAAGPGGAWLAGLSAGLEGGVPAPAAEPEGLPPAGSSAGEGTAGFLQVPVTHYTLGAARPDALGRVHVAAAVDVAGPADGGAEGYAARLVQDFFWRRLLEGPRLVGAPARVVLEVAVAGDRLVWRRDGGAWQPGLGLADLPSRAAPPGGPPGVEVEVSREGFGPLALAGERGVLLVTRGPRPLVALWRWSLDDPAEEPGRDVLVLDVLYHARGLGWQAGAAGRRATLMVEAEDGSRLPVVYDLEAGRPADIASPGGGE
ncbi:hypothetical protein [Thermaerobacter subterraneus]|uniref:Uncharacterized protein n=1 Tax=Thermaerobacter subterraneus DSM 13965 TaxID=867903 RepID=K6PZL4_9FIRM|nr:hypothetical protein [Thermaerobacter subterraneus]EKP94014.1 hypothetical protein ThesuDRAFT_01738 [Thermaerobacter subterraneus DSM 13965]